MYDERLDMYFIGGISMVEINPADLRGYTHEQVCDYVDKCIEKNRKADLHTLERTAGKKLRDRIKCMEKDFADQREACIEFLTEWIGRNPASEKDIATLDQVMTASEVAEEYGLSESTVRQAITRGTYEGEKRKSGGTWLVMRRDAQARWGKAVPKSAQASS